MLSDRNHLLHKYSFTLNFYRNNSKSLSSQSFEHEMNKSATEFSENNKEKNSDKFKSCNNYEFRKRSRKHESSSETRK